MCFAELRIVKIEIFPIFAVSKSSNMGKVTMLIGKSGDYYGAMSTNCEGIYAAGPDVESVKADTLNAIEGVKRNLPWDRWPKQIKGEFEIEWKFTHEILSTTL